MCARSSVRRREPRLSGAGAGPASPSGCCRFNYASGVGDAQRLTPDEQIRFARDAFEAGQDFTIAVEEEFALLDADTLELTNRFEELKAGAAGTELDEHVVGELIASEIEVKTGRCANFSEAAELMARRRLQLGELANRFGVGLACTGTHPWS